MHILGRAQYRSMSRHALIITINFAVPTYPRIVPRTRRLTCPQLLTPTMAVIIKNIPSQKKNINIQQTFMKT